MGGGLWARLARLFTGGKADRDAREAAERILLEADFGVAATEMKAAAYCWPRRTRSGPAPPSSSRSGLGGSMCRSSAPVPAKAPIPPPSPLPGLVITKLDGTAKGGSVVALRRAVPAPIRFLGTGESLGDLELFDPVRYAQRLVSG